MTNKQLDRLAREAIANVIFNSKDMTSEEREEIAGMLRDIQVHAGLVAFMIGRGRR